jgi:hypothetical protein
MASFEMVHSNRVVGNGPAGPRNLSLAAADDVGRLQALLAFDPRELQRNSVPAQLTHLAVRLADGLVQ